MPCGGREGDFLPRIYGGVSQFAMFSSARSVAAKMEEVVDRIVSDEELLACGTDLNRTHMVFPAVGLLARDLAAIVKFRLCPTARRNSTFDLRAKESRLEGKQRIRRRCMACDTDRSSITSVSLSVLRINSTYRLINT
ncbi:hypothetical protein U8P80_35965 (plasmid) [Rhizobium beringeri]|nr:hypothetical protein U8P80_35965 [Rhizobium beringeri]WSH18501.1 hypothetical protein U8P74_35965 [Rhizobium beringeri]